MTGESLIEKLESRITDSLIASPDDYSEQCYRRAIREAIAVIRKHQAEQSQDAVERVARAIMTWYRDTDCNCWDEASPHWKLECIEGAKAALTALGDGGATVAPVSAETLQAITPAKLHFSDCSIYDESGTENPDAECDCGGAVEDKTGTPLIIIQPDQQGKISVVDAESLRELMALSRKALMVGNEVIIRVDDAFDIIRPYLRTTGPVSWPFNADGNPMTAGECMKMFGTTPSPKPVPVSLERCAFAAWQNALHAENPGDIIGTTISKYHCKKIAKAVLDAAGVKHVD
jgi:hypothetical protein